MIKCLHATCKQATFGSVRLVGKVLCGVDEIKGNRDAAKGVLRWFADNFGIDVGPTTRARPKSEPCENTAGADLGAGDSGEPEPDEPPTIQLGVDTHRVVDEAIRALASDGVLFSRGNRLVDVIVQDETTADGTTTPSGPIASPVAASVLGVIHMSRAASWESYDQKRGDWHPARVPRDISQAVHDLRVWPRIRPLVGITETPVLRSDGSVVEVPGYDTTTGLLYRPSTNYETIPDSPTKAEAEAARDRLLEVVCDMPLDAAGRATWLAMVLTYFARPMFGGPAPFFVADGNTPGAAKSLSIKAAAAIATGRAPAMVQYSPDQDEIEKRITSVLLKGVPIFYFDNIEDGGVFAGAKLEALATADIWGGRLLGKSEQLDIPNRSVIAVTANNIVIRGAMLRRVVHIRFESDVERPEDRTGFRYPDLLRWIGENRAALVRSALTILRAWHVAGRPRAGVTLGSYEGWCRTVGEAAKWITGEDVTETRKSLEGREGAGDGHTLRSLYSAWAATFGGKEVTAAEIVRLLAAEDRRVDAERRRLAREGGPFRPAPTGQENSPMEDADGQTSLGSTVPVPANDGEPIEVVHRYLDLRDAITSLAPTRNGGLPDHRYLGRVLGRAYRRVVDGRRIDKRVDRDSVTHWSLIGLAGSVAGSERVLISKPEPAGSTLPGKRISDRAGTAGSEIAPPALRMSASDASGACDHDHVRIKGGERDRNQNPQYPHDRESAAIPRAEGAGSEFRAQNPQNPQNPHDPRLARVRSIVSAHDAAVTITRLAGALRDRGTPPDEIRTKVRATLEAAGRSLTATDLATLDRVTAA